LDDPVDDPDGERGLWEHEEPFPRQIPQEDVQKQVDEEKQDDN